MSTKGEDKTVKRLNAEKVYKIERKHATFVLKTSAGPHSKKSAVPLGFFIRNLLNIAKTKKEAKFILGSRKIFVNGIVRTELNFPVGLFDVISIPENKEYYRVLLDSKGRISFKEIKKEEANMKVCKVKAKHLSKGNKLVITTNDGRNLICDKAVKVNDSLVIDLTSNTVKDVLSFDKGALVYLIGGKHVSAIANVNNITPATMRRNSLVELIEGKDSYQTVVSNVFVIGKDKPVLASVQRGVLNE